MQAMLEKGRQGLERQATVDASRAAVSGATPEQQLSAQEGRNKSYAEMVSNLAAAGAQLKDQAVANYQNAQNQNYLTRLGLTDPTASIYANQASQWSQAGSNAFLSGASLLGQGLDSKTAGNGGVKKAAIQTQQASSQQQPLSKGIFGNGLDYAYRNQEQYGQYTGTNWDAVRARLGL